MILVHENSLLTTNLTFIKSSELKGTKFHLMRYQNTEQKPWVLLLIGAVHILYQSNLPFTLGITPASMAHVYIKGHFPNAEIKLTQCQGHRVSFVCDILQYP